MDNLRLIAAYANIITAIMYVMLLIIMYILEKHEEREKEAIKKHYEEAKADYLKRHPENVCDK